MIHHWGYVSMMNMVNNTLIYKSLNQEYVASLKHPLLLFEEYTPKDEQAWKSVDPVSLPKLKTSTRLCTLLEGYIEADAGYKKLYDTFVFEYDI